MVKRSDNIYLIYDRKCLLFDGNTLQTVAEASGKKIFCGAFVPIDLLIPHSLLLPQSEVDEETLSMKVELSFYQEGGLDRGKEYLIAYTRFRTEDGALWHIEAFAVEQRQIMDLLDPFVKRHPAVDLVAIPSLIYDTLYVDGLLSTERGTEVFFRLDRKSSSFSLYHNGRFVSSRQLPSMEHIAGKIGVETDWLLQRLYDYGFDKSRWPGNELHALNDIRQIFYEMFHRTGQSLRLKINQLGLSLPSTIWLDDPRGEIPGFWDLIDEMGYGKSSKRSVPLPEGASSLHPYLEARYLSQASGDLLTTVPNLSPYPRLPSWYQTHTGRLGIAIALGVLLLGAAGGYGYYFLEKQRSELDRWKRTVDELRSQEKIEKIALKKVEKSKGAKERKLKKLETLLSAWRESAFLARSIRNSTLRRREIEKDVDQALGKERINVDRILEKGSDKIMVHVTVPTDERYRIAAFMESLEARGYRTVDTQLIERNADAFHSRIEVSR